MFFDFETQSAADLPAVGGRQYAAHPSTRVLTLTALVDGVYHAWTPGFPVPASQLWPAGFGPECPVEAYNGPDLPAPVADAARAGRVFVAHNLCEFDYHVWRAVLKPVPARWYDTIHAARAAGLPARLDDLSRRFFNRGKDAGNLVMKRLMTLEPDGCGGWVNRHTLLGNVAAVARYNVADVVTLERVYRETRGRGEPEVIRAHAAVNGRGVMFDSALASRLAALGAEASARAAEEVARLTGGELHAGNLRSGPQVKKWLAARGVPLGDLKKQTVERLLADPDRFIEEVLDAGGDD